MLTDEEMHARMANGWQMGRPFTACGNGSTLEATRQIRRWLPELARRYGIYTLNDAGAGDMAWWPAIDWQRPIEYRPFDLIPRRNEVQRLDITTEEMPRADAILCRMVLNHLDADRAGMAIALFRRAAAYLIATQYDGDQLPQRSKQFYRMDLRDWLGEPIERCPDGNDQWCSLAVWRL